MDDEKIKKLKDQIWTTRVSRANAEKRLLNKNNFIQGINIYYSCITIAYSILSVIYNDNNLGILTVFMTISLLITVLYLNSLKYVECARDYRANYTKLHRLELELDDELIDSKRVSQIKDEYCTLLDSSCNHISYDYYWTVYASTGDYREKKWKSIRLKYYWNVIWRVLVKIAILILPIILYFMVRAI